jgi:hypothetical protein
MIRWIRALDRILKGEATRLPALQGGRLDVPLRGLSFVILLLGAIYGVCMGVFAVVARWKTPTIAMGFEQLAASAAKVPALFFLTLLVTFPSLYVFNALVGSRLTFMTVMRLLIATLGVMLAVLASFGTIIVFFSVCTTSYPFMVMLNVIMFAAAGFLGLGFLLQTLHRLSMVQAMAHFTPPTTPPSQSIAPEPVPSVVPLSAAPSAPADASTPAPPPAPAESLSSTLRSGPSAAMPIVPPSSSGGALDALGPEPVGRHVRTVFHLWLLLFALVGAQMGWVLRPFIGNPTVPFTLFRHRESNFFESVFTHLRHLFS